MIARIAEGVITKRGAARAAAVVRLHFPRRTPHPRLISPYQLTGAIDSARLPWSSPLPNPRQVCVAAAAVSDAPTELLPAAIAAGADLIDDVITATPLSYRFSYIYPLSYIP